MNNSIEKAAIKLSKTAQVNKVLNKVSGEVTASTVLNQCERMNNENMQVNFSFHGGIGVYIISAFMPGVVEPFYFESHYKTMESKSLAEIYQDLIGIEYEYEQKQSALQDEMK